MKWLWRRVVGSRWVRGRPIGYALLAYGRAKRWGHRGYVPVFVAGVAQHRFDCPYALGANLYGCGWCDQLLDFMEADDV